MTPPAWRPIDAFDLPEWLGDDEVTWSAGCALGAPSVPGVLHGDHGDEIACDLLAADVACPAPYVDDETRTLIHRAWRDGQVALLEGDGRLTLALPGVTQDADLALEAIGRLALAVGAAPGHYGVRLKAHH